MSKIMIIPGLAVRGYAVRTAAELSAAGHDARLLDPLAWRNMPDRLEPYGRSVADEIDRDGQEVDLLIGLSVGTQAAAVTAAASPLVRRLLLISPTVDPRLRSRRRLFGAFLLGGEPKGPGLDQQVPDWSRAGPARIYRGFASSIELRLEDVLPDVSAEITIVHCELDTMGSHDFAAALAADHGGRLVIVPGAGHSWPTGDGAGFHGLLGELLR
jgi:pimeloyl-ACP methyl ester carboxylesterase